MKPKLVLTCTMVAILLSLCACSPGSKQIEISYDDFMADQHPNKEVEIAVDDSLTVTLESNPTTGFWWVLTEITDQTVLAEASHEVKSPRAESPVGAGGKEVWTFKALKEGESIIYMEYSRPWAGGEKGTWTLVLTVVVK